MPAGLREAGADRGGVRAARLTGLAIGGEAVWSAAALEGDFAASGQCGHAQKKR
jgi:hypothetical protein